MSYTRDSFAKRATNGEPPAPPSCYCVRAFCPLCGYAVSAMSLAALADALNEHRRYTAQPELIVVPPLLP